MRTPDQRLRVFISSVLGELAEERTAARAAIEQLRLTPVMFELGARPHPPRALYRAYLKLSDVFVGIYWQKYGWVASGMGISGLEDELRNAQSIARLIYVKRPAPKIEPRLERLLAELRSEGATSYKPFASPEELRSLIAHDLALMLSEHFDERAEGGRGSARNLPVPTTQLIGRQHDVENVASVLTQEARRLVTLTGSGGIGKSRVALAVARATAAFWRDGTVFVDLSTVLHARHVPAAIAVAMGAIEEGGEDTVDAVVRRLLHRHALVVLDNFEHVPAAAPLVAELLVRCPGVHILATSRVAFRLRGEQEWRILPLQLPPEGAATSELEHAAAIRLFLERVQGVRPHLDLSDSLETVARLCRRLDAVPLPLELAAASTRLLTPEQILVRLDRGLNLPDDFLDLPERDRTLSGTLEWSHDLLTSEAQRLFARLSVFVGAFSLDAVEEVCGWQEIDVVALLSTLVEHNLVVPAERADGAPAFRMLETVRAHAAQRLRAGEDGDLLCDRLSDYLVRTFEKAATRLHGPGQAGVLRRLDAELANVLAVLSWAVERDRSPGRLLHAIGDAWVWLAIGGRANRLVDFLSPLSESPRAAMTSWDKAAADWLYVAGLISASRYSDVVPAAKRLLPVLQELGEQSRWGMMLNVLALSRKYEPGGPARREFEDAAASLRRADDGRWLAYALSHFGDLLLVEGELDAARAAHEEMFQIAQRVRDASLITEAHYHLAMHALQLGATREGVGHLATATFRYRELDHRDGLTRCLWILAGLTFEEGDHVLAARLMGSATRAREEIDLAPRPLVAEFERRLKARIQTALPGNEFEAEFTAGGALTAADALDLALAEHGLLA